MEFMNPPMSQCPPQIPIIDLSSPDAKHLIVKACEDFGFFKVINHGVPLDFISRLESEAVTFFSLPLSDKEKLGPANPFGYGSKKIGRKGDVGWIEYLLLRTDPRFFSFHNLPGQNLQTFRGALEDYMSAMKKMTCEILELMAEGLNLDQQRNVFSKLLKEEESDCVFRVNHYPPCPEGLNGGGNQIGFGEHTDPQIISVLRSNNTSGLQISTRDDKWLSVPSDHSSFFVNVGDSLQVMTNGRFRSVKHRVVTNSSKSRVSMIYFGGPPLSEKIAPLPSLIKGKEESLYKEFTWFEYKSSAYNTRLADNRLENFQRVAAS